MLLCLAASPLRADTSQLVDLATDYVETAARAAYPEGQISASVASLDPRLRLAACEDLELSVPGERLVGRVSVHARCRAPVNWGLYLSAEVEVLLGVVKLSRPVPRESVIRAADLVLVPHNLASLRDGYMTDIDHAVGLAARGGLRGDAVLYQHQLAKPRLVTRGDTVTVAASHGSVTVTTRAVALGDGTLGEQIEVRNLSSERTLTAWVTGRGSATTRP